MPDLPYLAHIRWQVCLPASKPLMSLTKSTRSHCATAHLRTRSSTEHLPEIEDLNWLPVRRVPRHCFLDAATIEMLHATDHYRGMVDGLNLQAAVQGRACAFVRRIPWCGAHMTCTRTQLLGSMQSAVTCRPSSMGDSWRARPWLHHCKDTTSIAVSLSNVMAQINHSM